MIEFVRQRPNLYRFLRTSLIAGRGYLPRLRHEDLPYRIHPNDFMLRAYSKRARERYRQSGLQQIDQLYRLIKECGLSWDQIDSFLEIGSGYGRHTRWLVQHLPPEKITVADVTKEAVEFCVSEFGVKGVLSNPDISPEQFEKHTIIYAYSLLTHVSERRIDNFFTLLHDCLEPGGVAMFTVHGPSTFVDAAQIKPYLDPETIRREVEENGGLAFYRYPHYLDPEFGDTFVSESFVQARMRELCPNLKVLRIESNDDRNDLWVAQAAAIAA